MKEIDKSVLLFAAFVHVVMILWAVVLLGGATIY